MTNDFEQETRKRLRRKFRLKRKQLNRVGQDAGAGVDKYVFDKIQKVASVKRFLVSWLGLLTVLVVGVIYQTSGLGRYYLRQGPIEGGTYREGIVGTFTNGNPIFATGTVDSAVSGLIFNGLLTYDSSNNLVPSLAQEWSVDSSGKVYTVKLRDDVRWHDGASFSSDDVVYTFQTIQNPDTRSPLQRSWQDVKISAPDSLTVEFSLSSSLAGFEYSLTTAIVPKHILWGVKPEQLRSDVFNTARLVGTGPFKLQSVEVSGATPEDRQEVISMDRNDEYFRGKPGIERFVVLSFRDSAELTKAFKQKSINAAVGMSETDVEGEENVSIYNIPLTSAVMTFLNNSSPILSDAKVRRALNQATDKDAILKAIGYPLIKVDQPFLKGQLGYSSEYAQAVYDKNGAEKLLDEAGWLKTASGIREKDGKSLSLRLFSQSLTEYAVVTQALQKQWYDVGVALDVILQPEQELQSGAIARHDYDVLVYGITIGSDSDIFPYWHSSQADPRSQTRLNLSEFKNSIADKALEAGRTRIDPAIRAIKYKPFSEAWNEQVPAIGLYQPRFYYVVHGGLSGFDPKRINAAADRFRNVRLWRIRTGQSELD